MTRGILGIGDSGMDSGTCPPALKISIIRMKPGLSWSPSYPMY
jgi:hypothetical protein